MVVFSLKTLGVVASPYNTIEMHDRTVFFFGKRSNG